MRPLPNQQNALGRALATSFIGNAPDALLAAEGTGRLMEQASEAISRSTPADLLGDIERIREMVGQVDRLRVRHAFDVASPLPGVATADVATVHTPPLVHAHPRR